MKLTQYLFFPLATISGAIPDLKTDPPLQNICCFLDIKQLYHKEYEIGLELPEKGKMRCST